jgi:hypothetical protein
LRNLGVDRHPSTAMRYTLMIVASAVLFGGVAFAQDSPVVKPKVVDTTKPETARDAPVTGPETVHDERKSAPETAGADRSSAPETARDPPASGPETARDDQRNAPETAASDRTNTPETATDAPTSRDSRRTAQAPSSSKNL